MASSRGKKIVLALVSVAISVGLVAWLISRMDLERAGEVLSSARPDWLLVALLLTCAIPFLSVLRWKGVLRTDPSTHLPFGVALRAVLMANVLNSFLPSKGGDMAKAVYLRRRAGLTQGIGTVVLERLVDLSVLGALGVVGFAVSGAVWGLIAGAILIGGVSGVFVVALFLPVHRLPIPGKIAAKFEALAQVFHRWVRRPSAIAQTLAGSLGTWSMAGLTVCALISAFGVEVSWGYGYAIFPLCVLAGLVPTTVSGVGTRDAAFVLLLTAQGALREEATLVGLGYTFFAYWTLSLISLPAVAWQLREVWRERGPKSEATRKRTTHPVLSRVLVYGGAVLIALVAALVLPHFLPWPPRPTPEESATRFTFYQVEEMGQTIESLYNAQDRPTTATQVYPEESRGETVLDSHLPRETESDLARKADRWGFMGRWRQLTLDPQTRQEVEPDAQLWYVNHADWFVIAAMGSDGVYTTESLRALLDEQSNMNHAQLRSLLAQFAYDPTNGTNSSGDIIRSSSNLGFIHSDMDPKAPRPVR